jgi:protein ImuA
MTPTNVRSLCRLGQDRSRTEVVDELRRLLSRTAGIPLTSPALPFGLPILDAALPQGGLACGALHEVLPETGGDMPAAFGFIAALLSRMPHGGPVLIVLAQQEFASWGRLHGHGLNSLGLDPARVILIETRDEKPALWAMEEALRSDVPALVVGAIGAKLDPRTSQRLNFAAAASAITLVLLRPPEATGSNAAATRWRIGTAEAARDRFGLLARWRWRVTLERCRNGRPGEWLVEYDHVAHRFSLAAALAHSAHSRDPGAPSLVQPVRRAHRS